MDDSSIGFEFVTNLSSYSEKKETWMVVGIILAAILLILILMLIALRHRISIAIELIREASKAITSMISTLFFPLVPWFFQICLFAWFVVVMAFLATSGPGGPSWFIGLFYRQLDFSSEPGVANEI